MSSPKDALEKAIEIAGSKSALARGLGITPWALSKWNFNRIPEERCLPIEEFTKEQVRAEQLRPDINWAYVRSTENSNEGKMVLSKHSKLELGSLRQLASLSKH